MEVGLAWYAWVPTRLSSFENHGTSECVKKSWGVTHAGKGPIKRRPHPPSVDRLEREVVAIGSPPSIGWQTPAIYPVAENGQSEVSEQVHLRKVFLELVDGFAAMR